MVLKVKEFEETKIESFLKIENVSPTCDVLRNDLENIQGLSIDLSKSGKRNKKLCWDVWKTKIFKSCLFQLQIFQKV